MHENIAFPAQRGIGPHGPENTLTVAGFDKHTVPGLQTELGGLPEHLYRFNIGGVEYLDRDMVSDEDVEDACDIMLSEVLPSQNRRPRFKALIESVEAVVPAELRHKLWLQFCFNDLGGLGQDDSLTFEDSEEHYRIEWFIDHLRECKSSGHGCFPAPCRCSGCPWESPGYSKTACACLT